VQGCTIHERYEQNEGPIGDSILSDDPVRKRWQQTWVANRGAIMLLYGNVKDGALVLEGEALLQNGTSVMQRMTRKAQDKDECGWAAMSKEGGRHLDIGIRRTVPET
jgi:hypothetical protein